MIEEGRPDGGFVLCYDGERVPFRVEFRRRKHLAITVHPDLKVEVAVPEGSTLDQVLPRVQKRAAWILKQRRYFARYQPTPRGRLYISGETHLYLGRQYRLKIQAGVPEDIKLVGPFFLIQAAVRGEADRVRALIDAWYRERARQVFPRRLAACLAATSWLELGGPPHLIIRRMAKRWGSCTRAGNILLNLELIRAPVHCIDYVITHELCHLKVPHHGKEFYHLLARCMPDWERRKERLESILL
jgi:predicted metal-dependent hydrolase